MKIIHQKFDSKKVTQQQARNVHESLLRKLPEDYIVISSNTEIISITEETEIVRINNTGYNTVKLLEIIEKAGMYDGLSK